MMTNKEKTIMAENNSRLRSSAEMSFQITAPTARRKLRTGDGWAAAGVVWEAVIDLSFYSLAVKSQQFVRFDLAALHAGSDHPA
jgi:hypothetical protein